MTGKASISDFNFSQGSNELTPFDVSTLLGEYADGRRKFNQIDLRNANLSDANLPYIHLEESLLQKADLRNAILAGSSLNHIDLSSANLSRVNLIAADLIRAKLAGANLSGAFLSGANLSGANLRKSNLTNCTLAGANLSGVDFTGAILKNTNLAGATLRGANLSAVDLSDLDLSELNLEGSILPEDQGGGTWMALKAGQAGFRHEDTAASDPSQELPDAYPLDALDDSYDDLFQNLADASDWLQTIEPHAIAGVVELEEPVENPENPFLGAYADSAEATANRDAAPAPPGDSPFEPDGQGDAFLPAGSPFGPGEQFDALEVDASEIDHADAIASTPAEAGPGTDEPDFPLLMPGVAEAAVSGAPPPADNPTGFILLPDEALPAQGNQLASPSASEGFTPPAQETETPQPALADQPTAPDGVTDESTFETMVLPKGPYNVHQHSHQEQVVKSIQAVLNRRTHYSLQRKLLEVYGKRCAITGCHIVPLLDTVLIDSWEGATVDHPANGLVLRCDIKLLYDLNLIAVHPTKHTVMLAPSLRESNYGSLQGQKIHLPKQAIYRPARSHLQAHLDHCKWNTYDTDGDMIPVVAPTPPERVEKAPQQSSGLVTKVAFLAGGMVLGGVLMGSLWGLLSLRPTADLDTASQAPAADTGEDASATPITIEPEHAINLQMGPLLYPQGGLIYNDSAYISVDLLRQAELIDQVDSTAEVIEANGADYVRATYAGTLDIPVEWDAPTRTLTLDCCSDPDIEPIDLAIEGSFQTGGGLIVAGSAYAPADALEQLNLDQDQVPGENFVEVDRQLYIRAGGLQPLGIAIDWDAETRTLDLSPNP